METLKWNKNELSVEFQNCAKLSELIVAVERRLMKFNKVVCKIAVNGLSLTDHDEKRLGETSLGEIETFEIGFRDSEFLLGDAIASLVDWVQQLNESVIKSAEGYRLGAQNVDAYGFSRIISNTQWLIEALRVMKSHLPADLTWEACENKLMAALQELEAAYRAQDTVLISDVLEYELSESLDQWRDLLLKGADSQVR